MVIDDSVASSSQPGSGDVPDSSPHGIEEYRDVNVCMSWSCRRKRDRTNRRVLRGGRRLKTKLRVFGEGLMPLTQHLQADGKACCPSQKVQGSRSVCPDPSPELLSAIEAVIGPALHKAAQPILAQLRWNTELEKSTTAEAASIPVTTSEAAAIPVTTSSISIHGDEAGPPRSPEQEAERDPASPRLSINVFDSGKSNNSSNSLEYSEVRRSSLKSFVSNNTNKDVEEGDCSPSHSINKRRLSNRSITSFASNKDGEEGDGSGSPSHSINKRRLSNRSNHSVEFALPDTLGELQYQMGHTQSQRSARSIRSGQQRVGMEFFLPETMSQSASAAQETMSHTTSVRSIESVKSSSASVFGEFARAVTKRFSSNSRKSTGGRDNDELVINDNVLSPIRSLANTPKRGLQSFSFGARRPSLEPLNSQDLSKPGAQIIGRPSEVELAPGEQKHDDWERSRRLSMFSQASIDPVDILSAGPWFMQKPDGLLRVAWDSAAAPILLYSVVAIPYETSFQTGNQYTWIDLATDIFWVLDMGIQCFTGFYDHGVLNMQPRKTVVNYLKTWFFLDLVALLPSLATWTMILMYGGSHNKLRNMSLVRALKATKLFKLLRVLKIRDFLYKVEEKIESKMITTMLGVIKLIAGPILFSHFVACLLWSIGRSSIENGQDSWVHKAFPLSKDPLIDVSPPEQYSAALYFAITITSTVGFGDITAGYYLERAWVMTVMMFASAMVGVVVSGIASLVQKAAQAKQDRREKLAKASKFLNHHEVSFNLACRVKQYLEMVLDNEDRMENQASVLRSISSSGSLYAEVNLATVGRCLTKHKILSKLPRDLLSRMADFCETLCRPPGEVLQLPGRAPRRLTYVSSGTVGVTHSLSGSEDPWLIEGYMPSLEHMRSSIAAAGAGQLRPSFNLETLSVGAFLDPFCILGDFGAPNRMAVTATFCELVVLTIEKFKEWVQAQRATGLGNVLAAYAAFELDHDDQLRQALDTGLKITDCLFAGEGLLHEAARQGATKCINLLLERRVDVHSKDYCGRRAMEYAVENKQDMAIGILAEHGARAVGTFGGSLPRTMDPDKRKLTYVAEPSVSLPPQSPQDESRDEFEARLSGSLDLSSFGQGNAKTLDDLYAEIRRGESVVQVDQHGIMRRYQHHVQVALRAKTTDRGYCNLVLVNVKNKKEEKYELPSSQICAGEDVTSVAQQILEMDLQLPLPWQEQHLQFAAMPVVFEEETYSSDYPQLQLVRTFYEVRVRVKDPDTCNQMGLPEGRTFSAKNDAPAGEEKNMIYIWADEQDCSENTSHSSRVRKSNILIQRTISPQVIQGGLEAPSPSLPGTPAWRKPWRHLTMSSQSGRSDVSGNSDTSHA